MSEMTVPYVMKIDQLKSPEPENKVSVNVSAVNGKSSVASFVAESKFRAMTHTEMVIDYGDSFSTTGSAYAGFVITSDHLLEVVLDEHKATERSYSGSVIAMLDTMFSTIRVTNIGRKVASFDHKVTNVPSAIVDGSKIYTVIGKSSVPMFGMCMLESGRLGTLFNIAGTQLIYRDSLGRYVPLLLEAVGVLDAGGRYYSYDGTNAMYSTGYDDGREIGEYHRIEAIHVVHALQRAFDSRFPTGEFVVSYNAAKSVFVVTCYNGVDWFSLSANEEVYTGAVLGFSSSTFYPSNGDIVGMTAKIKIPIEDRSVYVDAYVMQATNDNVKMTFELPEGFLFDGDDEIDESTTVIPSLVDKTLPVDVTDDGTSANISMLLVSQ